jgi:hypothetical protein
MNSLGGHVEYQAISEPFVPTYDFDPLYGGMQATERPGDKGKDTPGLGLLLMLAAVAAALVVVRRR